MKSLALVIATLLIVAVGQPCSISQIRQIWSKQPGSQSNLFAFERDGHVGFIDSKGKIVIEPTIPGPIDRVGDFFDGLARVEHEGYIGESGEWVIKGVYQWLNDFSDGLALANPDGDTSIYLDRTGAKVVEGRPFRVGSFSEGLAVYEAKGKPSIRKMDFKNKIFDYRDFRGLRGFIGRTGQVVIQPIFADVGPFRGGLARAALDGYCHLAMPEGGNLGSATTGDAGSCGGAPADAVLPCRVGFIDRSGQFAIPPTFESARDFQEGLAAVRVEDRWGFIDAAGRVVIPPRFEQAQSFQEGLAAVRLRGKWGFIDRAGAFVIKPRFKEVHPFSDGMAVIDGPTYIDRTGAIKLPGPYLEATSFYHGLAAVRVSGHDIAYIDKRGTIVFRYRRK